MVNKFDRSLNIRENNSFFLFGARGTGKSTLLKDRFPENSIYIDLLDQMQEDRFRRFPSELVNLAHEAKARQSIIILDEIQRVPRLLDTVHQLIESTGVCFAITGSSGRKLRRGSANLLAGRALLCNLYPLTHLELGPAFNLSRALRFGTLPRIWKHNPSETNVDFLRSYALTYLREEIIVEQLVRNLEPFRNFLEVAAQSNGQVINYSRIAEDVGVDVKTVQAYFSILEDTLLGVILPAYHSSVRKRLRTNPRFYFFDTGVKRALERTITQELAERSFSWGNAFEHFIILELIRISDYCRMDWRFSYLRTHDGAEVDLVIDRPGKDTALVEIKSSSTVNERDVKIVSKFHSEIPRSSAWCLSADPLPRTINEVRCLEWREGIKELLKK